MQNRLLHTTSAENAERKKYTVHCPTTGMTKGFDDPPELACPLCGQNYGKNCSLGHTNNCCDFVTTKSYKK